MKPPPEPPDVRTRLERLAERLGLGADGQAALEELILAPDLVRHEARYEDVGPIGQGGMGEVRRVRDRALNRVMAMKIIRADRVGHPAALARFVEEAQTTAQLDHPGITPVHEIGQLPDGRHYFTMKEVRGRTLKEVIAEVHAASPGEQWETAPSGWSFRRLIDALFKVCEAVAYAHSRGVVHRDLKPSNVMVGTFGEVLVVDWGLARVRGRVDRAADEGEIEPVVSERSGDTSLATQAGIVTGTPVYMPPEQARGDLARMGPPADVYSLGAILYEILSGAPPFSGPDERAVLAQVLHGPLQPPGRRAPAAPPGPTITTSLLDGTSLPMLEPEDVAVPGPPVPEALSAICLQAMSFAPEDRPPDASALARAIGGWLEGAQRREKALQVLAEADTILPEVASLRARAGQLRADATAALAAVRPWEPTERKAAGWRLEDEARALEQDADLQEARYLQVVQGSLTHDPDLPAAHARLADFYHGQQRQAEAAGDARASARLGFLLRAHDRGRYAAWLRGDGAVTVETDPPGAQVSLFRHVERERRLHPEPVRALGRTPLRAVALPMGSWLLKLRAPGCEEVVLPVAIGRQERWDGVRPGDAAPTPVHLPATGTLDADDCYVPAGWFWSGGDVATEESLPRRRVWVDGFVMRRFPVTNREYLVFLDDLVAQGREEEALRHAPRERGAEVDKPGALIYGFEDGRFSLRPDAEGDMWLADWPALMVDWMGARAYAAWWASRTGLPWRLPYELEWEKAARGVDGRTLPWGDFADPTWACMHESHPDAERPMPAVVHSYPIDRSVYGVRGMAGNVRDWCLDAYRREGAPLVDGRLGRVEEGGLMARRVVKGGCWFWHHSRIHLALHQGVEPYHRDSVFGFRLARSFPREPQGEV